MVKDLSIQSGKVLEYVSKPVLLGDSLESYSEAYVDIVLKHFHNLTSTMMTLVCIMTLDNAFPIYFPLIEENPWLAIIFVAFLLLVSVALMNLVTAVIVQHAIDSAKEDHQQRVTEGRLRTRFLWARPKCV